METSSRKLSAASATETPGTADQASALARKPKPPVREASLKVVKKRLEREIAKRKAAEVALGDERRKYRKLLADSKNVQKQLRRLSHEVLRAQEEERKRISRELHDEISQILTGINVRLATLRIESAANAKNISRNIASAQRLVEKSVATVHRFARELRPAMLDDLGLIPALTSHLKEVRKRTGLEIQLTTSRPATLEKVGSLKRTVLYRIAQEAVKNVVRHAHATQVDVSVQVRPGHVCLEVSDNGKSFSVSDVLASKRRNRLGLLGMRERAEMVGGAFEIDSAPGKGTTVRADIPLRNGGEAIVRATTKGGSKKNQEIL
ncbi:MAG: sensor histidine kinase [Lentisphaeria bacterium]|nr:sensor histidine kinase [Lentisphaeria bacterium]